MKRKKYQRPLEKICVICKKEFTLDDSDVWSRTVCHDSVCVEKYRFLCGIDKRPKPLSRHTQLKIIRERMKNEKKHI